MTSVILVDPEDVSLSFIPPFEVVAKISPVSCPSELLEAFVTVALTSKTFVGRFPILKNGGSEIAGAKLSRDSI